MRRRTILIGEDDNDLSHFLATQCRALGFDVFRSPDAMHALVGAHRVKPALIVLDLNMPGGNGLSVCEMLASDREVCGIPVIIMSGQSDEDTIRRCMVAGARYVRKGPSLWNELVAAMCECLSAAPRTARVKGVTSQTGDVDDRPPLEAKAKDGKRQKIISIDDDPDVSKIIKMRLEPYGLEVFRAFNGMQGYWTCLDILPDVIITDLNMSDGDGNYILHRLKTHSLTQKTPVIVLTGQRNPALQRQVLSQGADGYLTKPLNLDELLEQLRPFVRLSAVGKVSQKHVGKASDDKPSKPRLRTEPRSSATP